ncbi:hypothetical protein C5B94_04020 [Clavibacter michiganensis]|uniref:hypothetical protein n=1 Tax=Clavibacter michiganensis TaxID=28447 RepID=UPI000CE89A9E|nr:hypothetical protein [Clavibacter michiganensis]PPF56096.1 hypothetical protein C5B94_04020 [Clavibacter michiganensis]
MASRDRQIDRRLSRIPTGSSKLGTYVGRDGALAVVNLGASTVSLRYVGLYLPPPGHPVQIETRDGVPVVTGPASPLPATGKIVRATTPLARVEAWSAAGPIVYELPLRAGYTPTIGDTVEITWSADGGIVQGATTPVERPPAPARIPAPGEQTFHLPAFTAIWSGSATDTWVSDDVLPGAGRTAGWGYGTKVVDTIPDTAEILSASIYLPLLGAGKIAPRFRLHPFGQKPRTGLVFAGNSYPLAALDGWVPLPLAAVDFLKANVGGLGLDVSNDVAYRGLQRDQYSGALDITFSA